MMEWRDNGPFERNRGLAISLALHGAVALALIWSLPAPVAEPETEPPAIEVALVEPPQAPETPEAADPAETADMDKAVTLSPEPAAQKSAPPEPAPANSAPSLPETADMVSEPETPEPRPAPDQAIASPEDQPAADAPTSIPVLRPVFEFGDRDTGPRVATDGDGVADAAPTDGPAEATDVDPPSPPLETVETAGSVTEPLPEQPDPGNQTAGNLLGESGQTSDLAPNRDPRSESEPDAGGRTLALPEIALPEATLTDRVSGASGSGTPNLAVSALAESGEIPPGAPSQDLLPGNDQAPSGATSPVATPPGELAEAARLFSPVLTEDRAAMTAMGDLPRAIRASQLCTTELREQLRRGTPSFQPELLPSYGLESGNVLAVEDAAFRANGAWYDVSFRCTVDDPAFKVSGFALRVGAEIPKSEWSARGFPSF